MESAHNPNCSGTDISTLGLSGFIASKMKVLYVPKIGSNSPIDLVYLPLNGIGSPKLNVGPNPRLISKIFGSDFTILHFTLDPNFSKYSYTNTHLHISKEGLKIET